MKRDMNLVRSILFLLEEHPHGFPPDEVKIDGYDDETIGYHILIMMEAGLIHGFESTTLGSDSPSAIATRLTWFGHDFWKLARTMGVGRRRKQYSPSLAA